MYSKQGALLQQFYEALEPRAADAMFALLGQCQHALEHRGTLALLNTQPAGASGAVLTVANYPIPPDSYETQYPSNGLAAEFFGKVRFRGVVEMDQPMIGDGAANIPAGAMWMWAGDIGDIPTGWAIMDGTANSVGNGGSGIDMRGYLPMQYTGSGDFANIGDAVAIDIGWSGDPIAGDSSTTSLTIGSGTTGITIDDHDVNHTHNITPSQIAGALLSHTTSNHTHTVNFSGNSGTATAGSDDVDFVSGITTSAAGSESLSHTGTGVDIITTNVPSLAEVSHTVNDTGHGHTGSTISNNTLAGALSINTPNALRPPGKVVAYIEKLAA